MRRQSDGEDIRLSGRTRLILRILFLGGLGWAWYWLLVEVPRRELWYLIGFSIALGVVFEWLERKVWSPRDRAERIVLELLFAAVTLMAMSWLMPTALPPSAR